MKHQRTPMSLLVLISFMLVACSSPPSPSPPPNPTPPRGAQLADRTAPDIPAVAERKAAIRAVLATDTPVLPLPGLKEAPHQAQEIALADPRVPTAASLAGVPGAALAEVFGVVPFTSADVSEATRSCETSDCWRVVIYSYGANSTVSVIVSLTQRAVLETTVTSQSQPEIPPHLAQLAVEIARASPLVQQELQMVPGADMSIYESVKTSLTGSQCERSRHLCVAPTFVWGDAALWAIIDLTDLALVGTTWTELGVSSRRRASEAGLQNEVVSDLCERARQLDRGDWSLRYQITASDGLAISDVAFRGQPLLDGAKIVDWHVAYPTTDPNTRTGFSDAIGCPVFSSAVVVPFDIPRVEPIIEGGAEVGFRLVQDFRNELWPVPCNYRYQNVYAFYADGRFQMRGVSLGRPCGVGGVYRPIFRIAPAGGAHRVAAWVGASWATWATEQWMLQQADTPYTAEGDQLQISWEDGRAYTLRPGRAPRPDNAWVYVTRYQAGEGDADLPSIGTCCREDEQQGPEAFINQPPEALEGVRVVIWYVPQMPNEERAFCWADSRLVDGRLSADVWPCEAGPTLVPAVEGS